MAAAYAAVVSLSNTMDQIQTHPRLSTCFDKAQIESLGEKVDFFLDFLVNFPNPESTDAENLMKRIAVAAAAAEDISEVEAADRIVEGSTGRSPSLLADLQKIIQDMNSIKEEVMKVKEEGGFVNSMAPPSSAPASSPPPLATSKTTTTVVGFEGYVKQLVEELTAHETARKIIPIVGMGGIGKTTLAKTVYVNPNIVRTFNICAWITVSQDFCATKFFLQALSCLGVSTKDRADDQQLSLELHRFLYHRRYLIILDDVWTVEAWDRIRNSFPDNQNRSRIVVTTRESNLVHYFGSSALAMDFLDDKNSWDLFCDKAFAEQGCPSELQGIGKQIVRKCKGLPLAIILVGGLLGRSPRNQEYWEKIANDKSLILDSGEGNKPLSILYLSYKHLPVWLKSCFLYLRLFPEDEKINVPQLIKLLVAEGLIKPKEDQCLEEAAESYIKELVSRNLVLVHEYMRLNKNLETCYVHDLVRDLCIWIAEKENFLSIQRDIDGTQVFILDERTSRFFHQNSDTSETPSIQYPQKIRLKSKVSFKVRLLRVSILHESRSDYVIRQVNLRFLNLEVYDSELYMMSTYNLPSSISLLWSLQTLFIGTGYKVVAPSEIWEMPQLRHIKIWSLSLPDPPEDNDFVLQNLQTLGRVENLILTEEVCKRIPSIKDLIIVYEFHNHNEVSSCYHLQNVGCFDKLETLEYSCKGIEYAGNSLQNLKLPCSLKKLTLEGCSLDWKMIGSLPHLEVLELMGNAVVGGEWNCVEEEFFCLKHLLIYCCHDLIKWSAESSNFPVLETLSLWFLPQLCEIPSGIEDIATLQYMSLHDCSESAAVSAVEILEEQQRRGNEGLGLAVDFFDESDAERWREKIKQPDFTCQNLRNLGIFRPIDTEEILKIADLIAEI